MCVTVYVLLVWWQQLNKVYLLEFKLKFCMKVFAKLFQQKLSSGFYSKFVNFKNNFKAIKEMNKMHYHQLQQHLFDIKKAFLKSRSKNKTCSVNLMCSKCKVIYLVASCMSRVYEWIYLLFKTFHYLCYCIRYNSFSNRNERISNILYGRRKCVCWTFYMCCYHCYKTVFI